MTDTPTILRQRITELEAELARHRKALSAFESPVQVPTNGRAPLLPTEQPGKSRKELVLEAMGDRWVTVGGLAAEMHLTRDQVRNVIHDRTVKVLFEKRKMNGGPTQEFEYRKKDGMR